MEGAMGTADHHVSEGDEGLLPNTDVRARGVSTAFHRMKWAALALTAFACLGVTAGTFHAKLAAIRSHENNGKFLATNTDPIDLDETKHVIGFPKPPVDYEYGQFLKWFQVQDWDVPKLEMKPTLGWFDVDGALNTGPRKEWFVGKDIVDVAKIAKRVNRFLFMQPIMVSGCDTTQASLPMHLLILWLVRDRLAQPGASVLDAGCGSGWLAQAFALVTDHKDSRVFGFDINGVQLARKLLADPQVISGNCKTPSPSIFHGDLLSDGFGFNSSAKEQVFGRKYDVINVGVALPNGSHSVAFHQLALLLKDNGKLTVPVCLGPPSSGGTCKADFQVYRRSGPEPGHMVQEVHSFYNVSFVVPKHNGSGR